MENLQISYLVGCWFKSRVDGRSESEEIAELIKSNLNHRRHETLDGENAALSKGLDSSMIIILFSMFLKKFQVLSSRISLGYGGGSAPVNTIVS